MRHASFGSYIVIAFCFFMPWFQVSCGLIQMEVTGYQIAKGSIDGVTRISIPSTQDIEAIQEHLREQNLTMSWWLFLVPIACILGIIAPLLRLGRIVQYLATLACILPTLGAYLYLRAQMEEGLGSIADDESGFGLMMYSLIDFEPTIAFWLSIFLGGLNLVILGVQKPQSIEEKLTRAQSTRKRKLDPSQPPIMQPQQPSLKEQSEQLRRRWR